jgi:hypothetical protein
MLLVALLVATTTVTITADEAVSRGAALVSGTVLSRESAWIAGRIVTFHQLQAEEVWRSAPGEGVQAGATLTVATLGGVVDEIGQRVPGMPMLPVGGRVLLNLGPADGPRGARGVVGLWRGAWRLDDAFAVPFAEGGAWPARGDGAAGWDVAALRARLLGAGRAPSSATGAKVRQRHGPPAVAAPRGQP